MSLFLETSNTSKFLEVFINVGNSVRLQLDKIRNDKFLEEVLSTDTLFPERSKYSRDLKDKKSKLMV